MSQRIGPIEFDDDVAARFNDPYDPWMTPSGVRTREMFYAGRLAGKIRAVVTGLADWWTPGLLRSVIGAEPLAYPITVAQLIMMSDHADPQASLHALEASAVPDRARFGLAWGLGFPWMSKNGLYGADIPFVTHTPYAMEALLHLASKHDAVADAAKADFIETWQFLDALLVMHESADELALSYAPVDEPRIVINANAYACFAYAMHGVHNPGVSGEARERSRRLARFVLRNQSPEGFWHYYADQLPGNFIDCFHSCFVLKNLRKAAALDPELGDEYGDALERGRTWIDEAMFDAGRGLARRFAERDIKDPFTWDLYDQAEYLGILIDWGEYDRARALVQRVDQVFSDGTDWFVRLDMFGRRWGRNFGRWGMVPYLYQRRRMERIDAAPAVQS